MTDWLDSLAEGVSNRNFGRRKVLQTGGVAALGAALSGLFPALASAASYPCVCGNCKVATIDESTGAVTFSNCSGKCVAESLCNKIVTMSSFTRLDTALSKRGFVSSTTVSPQALRMVAGTTLFGTVLALPFQASGKSKDTAQVIVFMPPSGAATFYAVVFSATPKFLYLLQANKAGKIVTRGAPQITLPAGADSSRVTHGTPSLSQSDCVKYATAMCDVTAFVLGTALIAGICAYVSLQTAGLAASACPWIFGLGVTLFFSLSGVCGKYANLLCTTQFIYCNCNKTDYSSATTCTSDCQVTLGCFTGICGPQNAGKYAPNYNFT